MRKCAIRPRKSLAAATDPSQTDGYGSLTPPLLAQLRPACASGLRSGGGTGSARSPHLSAATRATRKPKLYGRPKSDKFSSECLAGCPRPHCRRPRCVVAATHSFAAAILPQEDRLWALLAIVCGMVQTKVTTPPAEIL